MPEPESVVVSATLYRTFLSCPQQALGRLHGHFPAERVPALRGQLAHRIFARHLTSGAISDGDVARACRQEIGAGLNSRLKALGISKPSQLAPVIAEVADLYTKFRGRTTFGFRAAEVELEAEAAPGVTVRGVVDAVFDDPECGIRIVDWKTGSGLDGAVEQLAFYCFVWWLERGYLPGRAEAISVATGERVGVTPTEEQVAATEATVNALVVAMRQAFATGEDLERRAGPHCRHCPLLETCGEGAVASSVVAAG